MILKHFFDISTGFRYKKKMEKSSPSIYRDVHDLHKGGSISESVFHFGPIADKGCKDPEQIFCSGE